MALTTSSNKFRVITTNNTSGLATSSKFSDINSPALVVNTSEGGVFYAPGNSSTLTQLAALPGHTHSNYATTASLANYLPKTGGQLAASTTTILSLNNTNSTNGEVGLRFDMNSSSKGWVGYNTTNGTYLYNYNGPHRLGIKDNGTGFIDGNTIIHSGNISSQSVASATNSTNATNASNIYINNSSNNGAFPLTFVSNTTKGSQAVFVSTGKSLTFNPSTGNLAATTFTGSLSGNATSAGSASKLSSTGISFTPAETALTPDDVYTLVGGTTIKRGTWSYAGNGYISNDVTGVGTIDLAGTTVIQADNGNPGYTQLYLTPSTGTSSGYKPNEIFMYNNNGSNYYPSWTRVLTNRNYTDYCSSIGHTHSSINDSASGAATTFGYSKAGLNYADYTYLAAWNGYELRAIHKSQFAQAAHTHVINKLTIKGIDAATTYGDYMGILQSASIDAMPSGTWFNVIKILHNNSSGYYTELAQSFTGTEGLYHRRMSVGTKTPWKHVLDSANYADYCAAKSHTHTISDLPIHTYNSGAQSLSWTDTIGSTKIPTINTLAYWNGAFSGTNSNLAYCVKGAFGTIVTKNVGDYAAASHTHTDYTSYKYAGDTVDSAENYIILSLASNGTAINGGYFYGNVSFNRGGSSAWNGKTMVIVACGGQYTSNIGAYFTIGASITIAGLYKIQYNNTYYLALKIGATSSQQVRVSGVYNTTPFVIKASAATSASQVTVSNLSTPGSITAANFITSSDKRLKTNIKSLPTDSKSLELNFYEFDYVNNDNHSAGHIAQEVKEVFPELVHGNESETEHLSIDYTGLHSIQINDLIGYIKRLEKRIIELENKLS